MHSTQNEQKHEEETHDEECLNILAEEIDSWNNFEYALREENRVLFNKMLSECEKNEDMVRAANSKDEFFSAESLFMALILQQQKTINDLIAKLPERKRKFATITEWMGKDTR
jgi:hypothetical protein